MAQSLAINGASKVFIVGRRREKLLETEALGPKGTIISVVGDVTSKESLQATYDTIASQTGQVDVLVANSGVLGPETRSTKPDGSKLELAELRDKLWALPMEDFSSTLHTNITGAFFTVVAFLPLLHAANKNRPNSVDGVTSAPTAQVIITSSIAGFVRSVPVGIPYNISKAGVNQMVKVLATYFSDYDIRVNGIAPGPYKSEMSTPMFEGRGSGVADESMSRQFIPLGRGGSEQDISGLLLFMTGVSGGFLNGCIIVTDGGRLSVVPASY